MIARLKVWQEKAICAKVPEDRRYLLRPESEAGEAHNHDCGCPGTGEIFWWARYSAPETDVVIGESPSSAAKYAFELYGNEESPEERSELAAVLWQCRKLERPERG